MTTVEELIKADGSLTIDGISEMVGISHSMVQRIVQEDLDVVWYKTKWVLHTLLEQNKAVCVDRWQILITSLQSRLARRIL